MTIEEVAKWFGNLNRACLALGLASQNFTRWKEQGYIPWKQQFRIAYLTEGELMPDDEDPNLLRLNNLGAKQPKERQITRKVKHESRERN